MTIYNFSRSTTVSTCPDCGVEIFLDISELFSDGESDLYGTAIFCPECSKSRLEEF
jgi:DNA-directed RNA polymerase subunit RPC12/RpoP